MFLSRPPFRPSAPLASLLLVWCCLQGCLSSRDHDAGAGNPTGGGNPPGETPHVGRGFYTVEFTAASSRLNLDSNYTVKWQASDLAGQGPVRVSLYRNDTLMDLLTGSSQASGSFGWNLALLQHHQGNHVGSGSGYRLRIENEADSSKWDFGPSFALYSKYSGSLALTSPAPGAQVRGDSALRIAWTGSGNVGDQVGLQLYWDATLMWTVQALVPAAGGEFLWSPIPEWLPSGDGYRFRIYAASDASIEQIGPNFTLTLPTLAGTYAFLHPQSGDVWLIDEVVDVEWTVTGNPGSYSGLTLWRDSPRELVHGWTPGDTYNSVRKLRVSSDLPANLPGGTYRMRIGSLADTTLFAFSPAFIIQGTGPR